MKYNEEYIIQWMKYSEEYIIQWMKYNKEYIIQWMKYNEELYNNCKEIIKTETLDEMSGLEEISNTIKKSLDITPTI